VIRSSLLVLLTAAAAFSQEPGGGLPRVLIIGDSISMGYTDANKGPAAAPAPAAPGAPAPKPAAPAKPTLIVVNGDKREPVVVPVEYPRGGI